MERFFYLYLDGCAIKTSVIDVLSHINDQCNTEANCEALPCSSGYFKTLKITVKASE